MNLLNEERVLTQAWFASFTEKEKCTFESIFGRIASLLHIHVTPDFAIAASSFWLPELSIFRFGMCEMTPTIEEYCAILNAQDGSEGVCKPEFPPGFRTSLSDLLGIKRKYLEIGSDESHPRITVEYLLDRFATDESFENHRTNFTGDFAAWKKKRVMALGFLLMGTVLFPQDDVSIDGRISTLVTQLHQGRSYIPMVLAETYRALTRLHAYPHTHFGGCIELFYLWLVEHVMPPRMTRYFCISIDPIRLMSQIQATLKEIPKSKQSWSKKLGNLSPSFVNWFAGFYLPSDIRVRSDTLAFIPLVGLTCVVPYFGGRVLRQLGHRQGIPLEGNSEEFNYDFENDYKDMRIQKALKAWNQRLTTRRWKNDVIEAPSTVHGYDQWLQGQITRSEAPRGEATSTMELVPTEYFATTSNSIPHQKGQAKGHAKLKIAWANHSTQVSRLKLQNGVMAKKQRRMAKQIQSLKRGLCQQIDRNAEVKRGYHQLSEEHEKETIQIKQMEKMIFSLQQENKDQAEKLKILAEDQDSTERS